MLVRLLVARATARGHQEAGKLVEVTASEGKRMKAAKQAATPTKEDLAEMKKAMRKNKETATK